MGAMNRSLVLNELKAHAPEWMQHYGARSLALFGSAARDEMTVSSDIDILVEFEGRASFDAYFGLKDALEAALGRPVDLVTRDGLKPRARQHVERDLIRVA